MYTFRNYLNHSRPVLPPSQYTLSRQIMSSWQSWKTNIEKSNNLRTLQQFVFHSQQTVQVTSDQDLDPRPYTDNSPTSVLPHEMTVIEPGENPTRTLTWKSVVFLSHIKCRTNDDRFPLLWCFLSLPDTHTCANTSCCYVYSCIICLLSGFMSYRGISKGCSGGSDSLVL